MTMRFKITTARKSDTRARIGLCGPAGSGKSYTAISIARGLTDNHERIIVLDTENGSAAKYADGRWKHLRMPDYRIETYIDAITYAQQQADVVIIDSLSHAWAGEGGALAMVDNVAKRMRNNFAAWGEVTPLHNRLVETMLQCSCHLIVTMRSKTEYLIEEDHRGKKVPRKIGTAPVQRAGMEYEFDIVGDMDHEHNLVITKTRCSSLDDLVARKPGAELGRQIRAWLSDVDEDGVPERQGAFAGRDMLYQATGEIAGLLGLEKQQAWDEHIKSAVRRSGAAGWADLSVSMAREILDQIRAENTPPDDGGFDDPFAGELDSRDTNLPPSHEPGTGLEYRGGFPQPEGVGAHPDSGHRGGGEAPAQAEPVDELDNIEELTDRQRDLLRKDSIRTRDRLTAWIVNGGRPHAMRETTLRGLKVSLGLQKETLHKERYDSIGRTCRGCGERPPMPGYLICQQCSDARAELRAEAEAEGEAAGEDAA